MPKLALPKLAKWDVIALVALIAGGVLIAANLALVTRKAPGTSMGGGITGLFVLAQVAVALGGLSQDSRGVVFSLLLSSFWIAAAAFFRGATRDA